MRRAEQVGPVALAQLGADGVDELGGPGPPRVDKEVVQVLLPDTPGDRAGGRTCRARLAPQRAIGLDPASGVIGAVAQTFQGQLRVHGGVGLPVQGPVGRLLVHRLPGFLTCVREGGLDTGVLPGR